MVPPACRWALTLAACWLATAPGPTKAQVDAAVPAEPLPVDVQLLFDIELRGPPGGATNLLPWTAAKEAVVVEVLCRGYLPSATPADVTIEVINTFTFLVPAPTVEATSNSAARRLLRDVAPPQPVGEETQLVQGGQQARRPPVAVQRGAAEAPVPAEQPVLGQDAAAAPVPAKAQVGKAPEVVPTAPALAPDVAQPEVSSAAPAPAPAAEALARRREKAAALARAEQRRKEDQQREEEAAAPAPATVQPAWRREAASAEAPAPATERPERQAGAAPAPAPAEQPDERDGKARQERRGRQERQQEEEEGAGRAKQDAPRKEEEAPPEQMVTGTGVELKIALPSTLARAAAELDAVEGAVTVGKLAQDLTAAGLAVDSANLVAAYLEEPQPLTASTTAAALAYGGAPAAAP